MYMNNSSIINNFNNKIIVEFDDIQNINNTNIINEFTVSKILSCPTEENIKNILKFIQKNNLKDSFKYLTNILNNNGISLIELINCIYEYYCNMEL